MPPEKKELMEVADLLDSSDFLAFAKDGTGIMIVPQSYGEPPRKVLFPEAGTFAKWMRAKHHDVQVHMDSANPHLDLRDHDIWMPLIYLSQDVSLQLFLGIVANYLYDRLKGALKGDRHLVHLDVHYEDTEFGKCKSFNFVGDVQALEEAMKQFRVNKFLG